MSTSALRVLREPPDADRHVRWCGSWGLEIVPGYPIRSTRIAIAMRVHATVRDEAALQATQCRRAGRLRCADFARARPRRDGALHPSTWSDIDGRYSLHGRRNMVLSLRVGRNVAQAGGTGRDRSGRSRRVPHDSTWDPFSVSLHRI